MLSSGGRAAQVRMLVDSERKLYAQWGLGVSSFWHVLNPWSLWSLYKTGKQEGICDRRAEWQQMANSKQLRYRSEGHCAVE